MRGFSVVALSVLLTSCVQPSFNYDRNRAIAAGVASTQANVDSVVKSLNLVKGLNSQLVSATHNRRRAEVVASEVLFYGTLLTVIGAAGIEAGIGSDAIHTRNIGTGLGFGATIFSNRYKVQDQVPVFRKAAQRLACVQPSLESIAAVESELIALVGGGAALPPVGDKSFQTALGDIPYQVVFFIEQQTVPDLQAALSSISLGQLSVEELKQVIEQWEAARNTGSTQSATSLANASSQLLSNITATANTVALNRAMTEVISFSETLQLCRTQHPF